MDGRSAMCEIVWLLVATALLSALAAAAQRPEPQTGHTLDISAVEFGPDDQQLVSSSSDDFLLFLWYVAMVKLRVIE